VGGKVQVGIDPAPDPHQGTTGPVSLVPDATPECICAAQTTPPIVMLLDVMMIDIDPTVNFLPTLVPVPQHSGVADPVSTGVNTEWVQETLNKLGWQPELRVDGSYGDKTTRRAQWELWKAWLVDCGYIYPDRTQMNETYRWVSSDHYWRLVNAYVKMRTPAELLPDGGELPNGLEPLPGMSIREEL
jgi:hypothetical protein